MFTDRPPGGKDRQGFFESDRINTLDLPQDGRLLPEIAKNIEAAMQTGEPKGVRIACAEQLLLTSTKYSSAASHYSQGDRLKGANGRMNFSATTTPRRCSCGCG